MEKLYEPMTVKVKSALLVIGALLALLMSAACQSFAPTLDVQQNKNVEVLSFKGKIAIKSPVQSFTGSFRFKRVEDLYELHLRDRLGLVQINLSGTEESTTIATSLGTSQEDVDLNAWLHDEFGLSLPFLELWDCISLSCVPIDEANGKKFNPQNQLIEFVYEQWKISIEYVDSSESSEQVESRVQKFQIHGEDTKVTITLENGDST